MKMKKIVSVTAALAMVTSAFVGITAHAVEYDTPIDATLKSAANRTWDAVPEDGQYINGYNYQHGIGYYHFSFEAGNISKATISMEATSTSTRSREVNLAAYGILQGDCITENKGNDTSNFYLTGTLIGETETYQILNLSTPKQLNIDATAYMQTLGAQATDAYIGIQWGSKNNASDSTIKNVKLTLTYTNTAQATYTVKFVGPDEEEVKADETRTGNVGERPALLESDKEVVYKNNNKYVYSSDNSQEVIISAEDDDTVTVRFTKADKYTYTINGTGDVDKPGLSSAEIFDGDKQNVYFPRYIRDENNDSIIYEGESQGNAPHYGIYATEEGSKDIKYTKKYSNVVYFIDCDESQGGTSVGEHNQASNGGVRNNSAWSTTLDKGSYEIYAYVCNRDRGSTISVGGKELKKVSEAANSQYYGMIDETFEVTEDETTVELTKGGSAYDPIDTVIICAVVPEVTFTNKAEYRNEGENKGSLNFVTKADFESDDAVTSYGYWFVDTENVAIVETTEAKQAVSNTDDQLQSGDSFYYTKGNIDTTDATSVGLSAVPWVQFGSPAKTVAGAAFTYSGQLDTEVGKVVTNN